MTVISEGNVVAETPAEAAAQTTTYYASLSAEPSAIGRMAGRSKLVPSAIESLMTKVLAEKGYVRAGSTQQPSLMIVYQWGEWSADGLPAQDVEQSNYRLAIDKIRARALMVGGQVFANQFRAALIESSTQGELNRQGLGGRGGPAANSLAQMAGLNDPVRRFRDESIKTLFLVDQSTRDCYFVVVKAYAFDPLTTARGELVWRTSMTVSTRGLSPQKAIPMLVAGGAPWLGAQMAEAEIIDTMADDELKPAVVSPQRERAGQAR